jgi:hypothetical protein
VRLTKVPRQTLDRRSETRGTHNGIIADAGALRHSVPHSCAEPTRSATAGAFLSPFLLAVDEAQYGAQRAVAILRSSLGGFGVDGVIVPVRRGRG